jgi:YD repeat-containing protein
MRIQLTIVDANGVSISRTFDWLGRMLTRSVPGQGTESFGYTARGLTSYTGPNGKTTQYAYDEARRKTSETTPKSEVIGYTYDPNVPHLRTGLTVSQPSGSWSQTYHYDAADRLHTTTAPAGTFTYAYSAGATLWTNLALPTYYASAITNGYDSGGRLLRTAMRSGTGSTLDSEALRLRRRQRCWV